MRHIGLHCLTITLFLYITSAYAVEPVTVTVKSPLTMTPNKAQSVTVQGKTVHDAKSIAVLSSKKQPINDITSQVNCKAPAKEGAQGSCEIKLSITKEIPLGQYTLQLVDTKKQVLAEGQIDIKEDPAIAAKKKQEELIAKQKAAAEVKAKAEAEKKAAEEKAKAEALAKQKAEEEKAKAEAEKKVAEEKAKAEVLAKQQAEQKAAEEKAKAEQEAATKAKAAAEKKVVEEKAKAEALAQQKAEEEKAKQDAEAAKKTVVSKQVTAPPTQEPAVTAGDYKCPNGQRVKSAADCPAECPPQKPIKGSTGLCYATEAEAQQAIQCPSNQIKTPDGRCVNSREEIQQSATSTIPAKPVTPVAPTPKPIAKPNQAPVVTSIDIPKDIKPGQKLKANITATDDEGVLALAVIYNKQKQPSLKSPDPKKQQNTFTIELEAPKSGEINIQAMALDSKGVKSAIKEEKIKIAEQAAAVAPEPTSPAAPQPKSTSSGSGLTVGDASGNTSSIDTNQPDTTTGPAITGVVSSPEISGVVPMVDGYTIIGKDFGSNKNNVNIQENGQQLSVSKIWSVTDTRIEVLSMPQGPFSVKVKVGNVTLEEFNAGNIGPYPLPDIYNVNVTDQGFKIEGNHLGHRSQDVTVFINDSKIDKSAINNVDYSSISIVHPPISGTLGFQVKVLNKSSDIVQAAGVPVPEITSIEAIQTGYKILGNHFGTDKNQLVIYEGGNAINASSINSLQYDSIIVRSKPENEIPIMVKVKGQLSNSVNGVTFNAPNIISISKSEPSGQQPRYHIIGEDFGYHTGKVKVYENDTQVDAELITEVMDILIKVNSAPTDNANIKVSIADRVSNVVTGPVFNSLSPKITAVTETSNGYLIQGQNFGDDKAKVTVFENDVPVSASKIGNVTDTSISIASKPPGRFTAVVGKEGRANSAGKLVSSFSYMAVIQTTNFNSNGYRFGGIIPESLFSRLSILENGSQVPQSAIDSITTSQLVVNRPPSVPDDGQMHFVTHTIKIDDIELISIAQQWTASGETGTTQGLSDSSIVIQDIVPTILGFELRGIFPGATANNLIIRHKTYGSESFSTISSSKILSVDESKIIIGSGVERNLRRVYQIQIDNNLNQIPFSYDWTNVTIPSNAEITGINLLPNGYEILGNFPGLNSGNAKIFAGNGQVGSSVISSVSTSKIVVNQQPVGNVSHRVMSDTINSNVFQYNHPGSNGPSLSDVVLLNESYSIISESGNGFGSSPENITVYENSEEVPVLDWELINSNQIKVNHALQGQVSHQVSVSGILSELLNVNHPQIPVISSIEQGENGFYVNGDGFGNNRSLVSIYIDDDFKPLNTLPAEWFEGDDRFFISQETFPNADTLTGYHSVKVAVQYQGLPHGVRHSNIFATYSSEEPFSSIDIRTGNMRFTSPANQ